MIHRFVINVSAYLINTGQAQKHSNDTRVSLLCNAIPLMRTLIRVFALYRSAN